MPPGAHFGEQPYPGKYPYEGADRSRLRPEFKRAYQACLKAFWDHVKEKGWEKKFVLYVSDEPFDAQPAIRQQMKALSAMIHEVYPAIPIYSSTWKHVPECDGAIGIWGFGHYGVVSPEQMARTRQRGDRIWYTTDGHMCIDTPYCAIERLLPHYCFKYGVQARAAGRDTAKAEQALAAAGRLVSIPNAGGRYSSKVLPDPDAVYRVKETVAEAIERLKPTGRGQ